MKIIRVVLYTLAIAAVAFLCFYRFWFLRQPQRNIPNNASVFVSPANGKVVSVKKWTASTIVEPKGAKGAIKVWTGDVDTAGTIVSIQMTPMDVHYQRAPQTGKVISELYTKGDFNNAIVMSNDYGIRFENEHNEIVFETNTGTRYKIIQIAGFVARRIEDYVQPKQEVKQGEVVGLIKLGSQVTVIFPSTVEVTVKPGDVTVDGETVIGKE